MKDVNLPQILQNLQFCFQRILQHPLRISQIYTSYKASLLYKFIETESTTSYSLHHVLAFASQLIQTKVVNILTQMQKLISSCALITNCLWHTVVLLKRQLSEKMNEWIWSFGGEILREERRITPGQPCTITIQSTANSTFWVPEFVFVLSSVAFLAEAFLRSIPKLRSCGLAWVCKLMLRWAQNKPIRLLALWC